MGEDRATGPEESPVVRDRMEARKRVTGVTVSVTTEGLPGSVPGAPDREDGRTEGVWNRSATSGVLEQ